MANQASHIARETAAQDRAKLDDLQIEQELARQRLERSMWGRMVPLLRPVRARISKERSDLLRRGNMPGQIEINSSHEHLVITQRRWPNEPIFPIRSQQKVNRRAWLSWNSPHLNRLTGCRHG